MQSSLSYLKMVIRRHSPKGPYIPRPDDELHSHALSHTSEFHLFSMHKSVPYIFLFSYIIFFKL